MLASWAPAIECDCVSQLTLANTASGNPCPSLWLIAISLAAILKSDFRGMSWVEITDQNRSWLTKAVAIQVSEGGHKSKRAKTDGGLHQCQSSDSADSESDVGADDATALAVVPVVPSVDVFSMLPPMPKRSPTPDPPVAKRTGKITSFFKQPAQAR